MNRKNDGGIQVIFIGHSFGLKKNNALSNLVRNISRGLTESKVETWLIPLSLEYGTFIGRVNGVKFYNPLTAKTRSKFLVIRLTNKILRYLRFPFFLRQVNYRKRTVLICLGESLALFLYCRLLELVFPLTLILYSVEHPFRDNSSVSKFSKILYLPLSRSFFDGYLCISNNLSDFFNLKNPKPTLIIPSVVDYSTFEKKCPRPVDYEYICYAGSVTREKDGVDILLRAFAQIRNEGISIKLLIIGNFFSCENFLKELALNLKINNSVVFMGPVDRTEIPAFLQHAKMLVLSRPDNLQNRAGFPTKIPEYLASGNPVIVSEIGDLPVYLKDKESVFFVKPGDISELTKSMLDVLNNYEFAVRVGKKGKEIANSILGYKYQGQRLKYFLDELML